MNKLLSNLVFQTIMGLLGRGLIQASLGLGAMLIAHVTDREKAIGTLLLLFLFPLAGYLHLTMPSIPVFMLRRDARTTSDTMGQTMENGAQRGIVVQTTPLVPFWRR